MFKQRFKLMEGEGGGNGGSGGGGGTPTIDWSAVGPQYKAGLPAEFQNHPALADIKDLGGLAKSYIHAQTMLGSDKVVLPKADAGAEAWSEFYGKLGRPSEANGYTFEVKLPDGFDRSILRENDIKSMFHKAGLTKTQANTLFNDYVADVLAQQQSLNSEAQSRLEAGLASLKKEWGINYDANAAIAKQAMKHFGGEEINAFLDETGFDQDPRVIKLFAQIGQALREDTAFRNGAGAFTQDTTSAQAEIGRLQQDREFMKAYYSSDDPGHANAVKRMEGLYKQAYPGMIAET